MILAIDCGSTNHKVALYDERLQRLSACSRPVTYTVLDVKQAEFDAEKIWQDTLAMIRQVCSAAGTGVEQIETIALASQAQTFTFLDKAGHPVMPFISWMDKRAEAESVELAQRLGENFHRHCSFPAPMPQLQLSKLFWMTRNHPERLKNAAAVVSLPGFLALRLAGLNCIDANLAAMSGLYSLALDDWWPAALETVGLRREQLGELVTIGYAVQTRSVCPEPVSSPRVRIVFAGNDQTAGAYANAGRSGQLVLTLGTALVVYRYAGAMPGPYHPNGCWGPYPGGGYYELATHDEGCAALDWAIGRMMPERKADFMKLAESALPGAAYFYPQRIRAEFAWTGPDDPAARARAVLEGICFSARQLIEGEMKIRLDGTPMIAIGGGSQNHFWLQMVADILNCPVRRGEGDILFGAAMMARPGVRAPRQSTENVMRPGPRAVATYERIYHPWQAQAQRR